MSNLKEHNVQDYYRHVTIDRPVRADGETCTRYIVVISYKETATDAEIENDLGFISEALGEPHVEQVTEYRIDGVVK